MAASQVKNCPSLIKRTGQADVGQEARDLVTSLNKKTESPVLGGRPVSFKTSHCTLAILPSDSWQT